MTRVLLLDNFDSFTFNILEGMVAAGGEVWSHRADALTIPEAEAVRPDLLVIGPGPGTPENARLSLELIAHFQGRVPILGICLGHQCIALAFGGRVEKAPEPVHGKVAKIYHDDRSVFRGLPSPFDAGRYHSLAVTELPECLEETARTEDGVIMGLRHRKLPIAGVQFHPDSFLTPVGPAFFQHVLHNAF